MKNRKKNPQPPYRHESGPYGTEYIVRDLAAYLTPEDVENALEVLRHRLRRKNARTARYVLELVFGKPRGNERRTGTARTREAQKAMLFRALFRAGGREL